MTDVRLTATNPEDSSVVPVACNAKGELKLEEPIAPPEFDGNLNGDLNVTGSAQVAGSITAANGLIDLNSGGTANFYRRESVNGALSLLQLKSDFGSVDKTQVRFNVNGSAEFQGAVNFEGASNKQTTQITGSNPNKVYFRNYEAAGDSCGIKWMQRNAVNASYRYDKLFVDPDLGLQYFSKSGGDFGGSESAVFTVSRGGNIKADGSAEFADGKAGITKDGHLWCTTVRGDTVILDATSGGIGSWQDYTPPTRKELLEERITDIRDAAIKPSQELPETDTGTQ